MIERKHSHSLAQHRATHYKNQSFQTIGSLVLFDKDQEKFSPVLQHGC